VAAVAARHRLTIGVCAHAGDGNTHPVVCFDAHDEDETRRARASFDEIMALGLSLGGTITGEHGVGLLKRDWLARELGPVAMELHRGIKAVFDPLNLLNPGKVF
jgi:glycolate oxidase